MLRRFVSPSGPRPALLPDVLEVDASGRTSGSLVQDNQRTTAQDGLGLVGVPAKVSDDGVNMGCQMLHGVQAAPAAMAIVVNHDVPTARVASSTTLEANAGKYGFVRSGIASPTDVRDPWTRPFAKRLGV